MSLLEARDLTVRFGGVTALAGVSFAVRPGTVTSLIGPNGAGKTTAFNVITGYLRPTRGTRARYDGAALTGLAPAAHRRRAASCARSRRRACSPALTRARQRADRPAPARARRRVAALLAGAARVRAEERAARARRRDGAHRRSSGSGRARDERPARCSYGEQRLVELAVALAARPRLLLLDEPASGMTGAEKDGGWPR